MILRRSFSKYIGSLDQGTGSTRFILFDLQGRNVASHQIQLKQHFPRSNFHEHDPNEIVQAARECIDQTMQTSGIAKNDIISIGITCQRETIVPWDVKTGESLYNAIVWDDTRTIQFCDQLSKDQTLVAYVKQRTGLPINPYFSASKIHWLINNVDFVSKSVQKGDCRFSTIDSWLLQNLTEQKVFMTDISNASRTLLMNLQGQWDQEMLDLFQVKQDFLPEIKPNSAQFGTLGKGALQGVHVTGSVGDQQAALMGHRCFQTNQVKNTFGTGSFILMNTGDSIKYSSNGLLTTVFAQFAENQQIQYALEGAIEAAGSTIQWLKNQLQLIESTAEIEPLLQQVKDTGGVYLVPAFSGLYAPYWQSDARGLLIGISQFTTKAHVVRALIEGICYRTREALEALEEDNQCKIDQLAVDGGMTKNSTFMQILADITGKEILVNQESDLTALGAAYFAGIGANSLDLNQINQQNSNSTLYKPTGQCNVDYVKWKEAIKRSQNWIINQ